MRSFVGLGVVTACVVVGAAGYLAAQGQAPAAPAAPAQGGAPGGAPGGQPLQNIKVLPKTWTRQQVQALMQTFVTSLGQQPPAQGAPPPAAGQGEGCLHCHVRGTAPAAGGRGPMVDYASDENPNKDIARKMIQLTMASNADYLKTVGDQAVAEKVSCYTCHRGESAKPANAPAAGWGRGSFSLLPAGPTVPARGAGAPGGAPGGAPPKG
jgi:hypothetical protein